MENKVNNYINLIMQMFENDIIKYNVLQSIEHLKVYLVEGWRDYFFWNMLSEVIKNEEIKFIFSGKKNISFYDFIGNEFMKVLHKKVGSKKRAGKWDFEKIFEFYTKNN